MPVLESYTENKVTSWARKNRVKTTKLLSGGGEPDRAFWFSRGRVVLCEFKQEGKRPTKLQRYRLEELRSLGHIAFWSDNHEEAIEFLAKFL